ncbi:hypothetical protein [Oceanimonas marisflavi]|uniref:hypothetical protein n=1 Tax=Oceanimonas marisflavi TaxID=2059724 RepID=UPI00130026A7|nr:hypothetical protein [Oceanimonas marisflavi]
MLALACALLFVRAASASELTGRWAGTYDCGSISDNPFSLLIDDPDNEQSGLLKGEFRFSVPGTVNEEGAFRVLGRFDKASKEFRFTPREWIKRPEGYTALGFDGKLHSNGFYIEGKIRGGCGNFSAQRDDAPSFLPAQVSITPASGGSWQGVWEGSISCKNDAQWPYRLTLFQHGNELIGSYFIDWPQRKEVVRLHGLTSGQAEPGGHLFLGHRMWLTKGRFGVDLSMSLIGDRLSGQVEGLPANYHCNSISLRRSGDAVPPSTHEEAIEGAWAGYIDRRTPRQNLPASEWVSELPNATQITLSLVASDNHVPVGIYTASAPMDKPPVQQDRYVYRLQPLTTLADGKIAYVPLGADRAEGRFRNLPKRYSRDPFVILLELDGNQVLNVTRRNRHHQDNTFQLLPLQGEALAAVHRGEAPAVPLGSLSGTLAQVHSLDQQCQVLVDWASPFGSEDKLSRMTGTDMQIAALPLMDDAVFEPVFGLPLMLTTEVERMTIYKLAQSCSRRVNDPRPFKLAGVFERDFEYDRLQAQIMNREQTALWLKEKLAEILSLNDKRASLAPINIIERELLRRKTELNPSDLEKITRMIRDKRRSITLAEFMQRVDGIPGMVQDDSTLVRLKMFYDEAEVLRLPADLQQRLTQLASDKASQILKPLLLQAQKDLAENSISLESLAALTHHQRRLGQLRNNLPLAIKQGIDFDIIPALDKRRRVMIENDQIQSAINATLLEVKPGDGSPERMIRRVALRYVDEQDLMGTTPLAMAVRNATEKLELRAVGLVDHSTEQTPGSPSAEEMFFAVKAKFDQVNSNLQSQYERCQRGDFQNDPLRAMSCLTIMAAGHGQSVSARITRFEKLGCADGRGQAGYVCDYVMAFETSSPYTRDTMLGDLMASGEVSQGRFMALRGGWMFTPLRRVRLEVVP